MYYSNETLSKKIPNREEAYMLLYKMSKKRRLSGKQISLPPIYIVKNRQETQKNSPEIFFGNET